MRSVRTGSSSCINGTGNNQILFDVLLNKASPCCCCELRYMGMKEELDDVADFDDQNGMRNNT